MLRQSYKYATRLGLTAQQIREDLWKKLAPPIPVDCARPHLPDEDGFYPPSLLPIWFLFWESHALQVDCVVLAGNVVHQRWLVDLRERLLPPCPCIFYPLPLFQVLTMLFLSHFKPPTSLPYVYHREIFAYDGVNYSCKFLDWSFVLRMDKALTWDSRQRNQIGRKEGWKKPSSSGRWVCAQSTGMVGTTFFQKSSWSCWPSLMAYSLLWQRV